jgi:hypothetical protein
MRIINLEEKTFSGQDANIALSCLLCLRQKPESHFLHDAAVEDYFQPQLQCTGGGCYLRMITWEPPIVLSYN